MSSNNSSCNTCEYYNLYKMIISGAYGYSGAVPCLHCSRFRVLNDEQVNNWSNIINGSDKYEENWRKFLTENVFKECWHGIEDKCLYGARCDKCGDNLLKFKRTFDNRSDMMDLYEAIVMDRIWEDFFWDFAFQRKPENYGLGEPETTTWLFCLSGEGYEKRCKMVAEFYGWEEKK